jgi:hypothetical protein
MVQSLACNRSPESQHGRRSAPNVRRRRVIGLAASIVATLGWPMQAQAVIVINGNAAFRSSVEACFERISGSGDGPADILRQLRQPSPQAHRVTIQPEARPGWPNSLTPAGPGALRTPAGPGPGSDGTVRWNPNNVDELQPGVPRDPCASLLHELAHAADGDKGLLDPNRHGSANGIPEAEVRACREENKYRALQQPPLPERTNFDVIIPPGPGGVLTPVPLPADARPPF